MADKWESVLQTKDQLTTQMLDFNKRLDRTVIFYLTAAYAAIGLRVSGQLNLDKLSGTDSYVWLVFAFIFLNAGDVLW